MKSPSSSSSCPLLPSSFTFRNFLLFSVALLALLLIFAFARLSTHQRILDSNSSQSSSSSSSSTKYISTRVKSTNKEHTHDANNNVDDHERRYNFRLPTFPADSTNSSGSSSICPSPFSTVDGLWGLNNPRFNSLNYYREFDEKDELEGVTGRKNPRDYFGKWQFYPRKRSQTLERFCRQKKAPEFASNPRVLGECEWTLPDEFTPFAGKGDGYLLDRSVANYNASRSSMSSVSSSSVLRHHQLSWCYDFQSPISCLRDKTIIFLGDSHIRNIAQVLCRMLLRFFKENEKWFERGLCGSIDTHFDKKLNVVYLPRANCTLAYLRVRYHVETQLKNRIFTSPTNLEVFKNANYVVYGRNLWDLVFVDRPRNEVMEEFTSDLNFMTSSTRNLLFPPSTKFIIKIPHYTHYKHRDSMTMSNIRLCMHWSRQVEQRDAIICGLRNFVIQQQKTENRYYSLSKNLLLFDVFGMSRETRVLNGTDHHGHHYEGTVMESMVQQFLSLICPMTDFSSLEKKSDRDNYYNFMKSSFLETAKLSCDRMIELKKKTKNKHKIEKCACGDSELVKSAEANAYCEELRKMQIEAPFVVNE